MKHLFCFIALFLFLSEINATKRRVNNTPGIVPIAGLLFVDFLSAQTAASNGDTIYLEPSSINYFIGNISKRLVIIGPGYLLDQNTGTPADKRSAKCESITLTTGSSNSVLKGLEIVDAKGESDIIFIQNTTGIILSRCKLLGISGSASSSNWTITQCIVTSRLIISSSVSLSQSIISNNIILGHVNSVGTSIVKNNLIYDVPTVNADLQFFNNIFIGNGLTSDTLKAQTAYNNVCVNCSGVANNNNFYTTAYNSIFAAAEPRVFDDLEDARFMLAAASPAKTKGVNGVDCGPFAGNNPYVLSGIPPFPSITALTVGAQIGSNIPVTFSAKRNN